MKKVSKITGFIMLVLSLVVSMTGIALAASSDLTGMKDDVYSAEVAVPGQEGSSYKMNFTVSEGKVQNFSFGQYAGAALYSKDFLAAISDANQKAMLEAVIAEQAYYTEQMASVGDALKIPKYSEAINDDMYSAFQSLWKQLVAQGGGKVTADQTTTPTSSNPQTGDNGILGYALAAGAALVGMALLRKKKLTA
ncbi:MAG: LPXTG cell wall anchor domain-containing protein [Neobacillus sp.]